MSDVTVVVVSRIGLRLATQGEHKQEMTSAHARRDVTDNVRNLKRSVFCVAVCQLCDSEVMIL